MTTTPASASWPVAGGSSPPRAGGFGASRLRWAVEDAWTVTVRNLLHYVRIPESLFFSSFQPVMLTLLFRYVFGGAIKTTGHASYVDFLVPGIFVQSVAFGAIATSIGLAEDLHKGLVERFRALPIARSAVLAGRTTADLLRNVVVAALITGVAFAVGFRVETNALAFLAGLGLILLFAYALSWGFALVGLLAPNSETAQVMALPVLFPLTFASSAFVPVQFMPSWLQGFANHQPVSVVVDAARALMVGGPTASSTWQTVAWSAGILAVLVPLSVRRYRRVSIA